MPPRVRSFALLLFALLSILTCLACLPHPACANKTHGFGGGGQGDNPNVSFYIVDPSNSKIFYTCSAPILDGTYPEQAPDGSIASGTGFVQFENLDFPAYSTFVFTFYYGPSMSQLTEIETDTVTFGGDGDPGDNSYYYTWPYPVVVNPPVSVPYDFFVTAGAAFSGLAQINNAGIAVGYRDDIVQGAPYSGDLAIMYSESSETAINTALGGSNCQATCINNAGDIGAEENDNSYSTEHGVLLAADGAVTTIDPDNPFYPASINAQDTLAGVGGGGGNDACVYVNGAFIDLQAVGLLPGGTIDSDATGVNDSNVVCGTYYDAQTDQQYAFTWKPGNTAVTTLPVPDYLSNASAAAINEQGSVVGSASDGERLHALLWNANGNVIDLGTLRGGSDIPTGINDLGQVTGNEENVSWLWDPYLGMTPLYSINPVYPPVATGVNDLEQILGGHYYIGNDVPGAIYASMILASSILSDPSFSAVNVGAGGYSYDPSGSPWTFTGYSGIAADGSAFEDEGWPTAPCGSQFAFLQSAYGRGSQVSQTIAVPSNGGYAFSFFAMQRDEAGRDNTGSASFQVAVDGQLLGDYLPAVGSWHASAPRTSFTQAYETAPIELTAGSHTLTFTSDLAPWGANNTALLNGVSVSLSHPAVVLQPLASQIAGTPFSLTGMVYNADGTRAVDTPLSLTLTGPGTLSSGTTNVVTDADGTFSFSGLTINTVGTGYSLTVAAVQLRNNTFASTPLFTVASSPRITGYAPGSGPVGTSVTIYGTNFIGATSFTFNGTAASFTVVSATTITTTVPSGASTGHLSVTNPAGTNNTSGNFVVTAPGAPNVTNFTPGSGSAGTAVTITGINFMGVTSVKFNTAAASFTVVSSTSIKATVPSGATTGPITVTNPDGSIATPANFTVFSSSPTITSFSPTSGGIGTSVTITGTNIMGSTSVLFNGTKATTSHVVNSTTVTATVPAGATTGKITVTTPGGTATSSATFTVIPAPTVTSFTPMSGSIGTSITIMGTNIMGSTSVLLNGTKATTSHVVNTTTVTATVPTGATTGKITVTTPGGSAVSSATFTVTTSAPTITSFSPTSGGIGTSVTITGTNIMGSTSVLFNGTKATTSHVVNTTTVTATVPAGATTGKITVTTPGGSAVSSGTFTVN